jgi:hypothetical protein
VWVLANTWKRYSACSKLRFRIHVLENIQLAPPQNQNKKRSLSIFFLIFGCIKIYSTLMLGPGAGCFVPV